MMDDNQYWIDPETGERHEPLQNDEVAYIGCVVGGLIILVASAVGLVCLLAYCLTR